MLHSRIFAQLVIPFGFAIVISAPVTTQGAIYSAASPNVSDIQAKVNVARDGDRIVIPAGTATWKTPLEVDKNITLRGAGAGATVIIDEVPATLAAGFLLRISLDRDLPFRMTGITFRGGIVNTRKKSNGVVRINGNCHSFRIDRCTFENLHGSSLAVTGFLWGVIDHNTFNCITTHPIFVKHTAWNGEDSGHGSWADNPYWGTEKFVFIEDNTFEGGGTLDAYEGARFVVRYNSLHNCDLGVHGTEGQGRGTKQLEEYNNIYVFDQHDSAGQIRSGSIITHDNTWRNVGSGHVLQDYRYYNDQDTYWGIANGQNVYDLNSRNGTVGYWATGKHTGPDHSSSLVDTNSNKVWWDESGVKHTGAWPTNRWWVPGKAVIVRNMTQAASNPIAYQSWALSSEADKIQYSQTHFESKPPLKFNHGDTYQIWEVARLLDQPGVGKGDLLTGIGLYGTSSMASPKVWPDQINEPCYSWNNTDENGQIDLKSAQGSIKEGRDFFNRTRKPGYTPYTYPHPLTLNN